MAEIPRNRTWQQTVSVQTGRRVIVLLAPAGAIAIRASWKGNNMHHARARRSLARLRYQLAWGSLITVAAPTLVYNIVDPVPLLGSLSGQWTLFGTVIAFLITLYLFRRVGSFPGVGMVGHVLPAAAAGYGVVVAIFFLLRLEYSRLTFFSSFIASILFFLALGLKSLRGQGQRYYLIPSPSTEALAHDPSGGWVMLASPKFPPDPAPVFVADLRADLGDDWERLIADAAVAGHPVYHLKQIQESLTGRVEIEHLSENSFGSLIPNHSYGAVKRAIDIVSACLFIPALVLLIATVGIAIKLDSPGPMFFKQQRRGYRGSVFEVLKFRTMAHQSAGEEECERQVAITEIGDARITKVGRFLRRTRLDELPQVLNIIKGDMSWIGPRPEALPLSNWYMAEIPFYSYRHIVRPGITGWAQVNQGHVADLGAVHAKLCYDFYYIKNYSAWLDILIFFRTFGIVVSGFGAK